MERLPDLPTSLPLPVRSRAPPVLNHPLSAPRQNNGAGVCCPVSGSSRPDTVSFVVSVSRTLSGPSWPSSPTGPTGPPDPEDAEGADELVWGQGVRNDASWMLYRVYLPVIFIILL